MLCWCKKDKVIIIPIIIWARHYTQSDKLLGELEQSVLIVIHPLHKITQIVKNFKDGGRKC